MHSWNLRSFNLTISCVSKICIFRGHIFLAFASVFHVNDVNHTYYAYYVSVLHGFWFWRIGMKVYDVVKHRLHMLYRLADQCFDVLCAVVCSRRREMDALYAYPPISPAPHTYPPAPFIYPPAPIPTLLPSIPTHLPAMPPTYSSSILTYLHTPPWISTFLH